MRTSKEPWKLRDTYENATEVVDAGGINIGDLECFSDSDCRRIVACVNACEGISTERLERKCECSMRTKLVGDGCDICNSRLGLEYALDNIEQLEHQNAELVEALKAIRDGKNNPCYIVDQALSKHKGEA